MLRDTIPQIMLRFMHNFNRPNNNFNAMRARLKVVFEQCCAAPSEQRFNKWTSRLSIIDHRACRKLKFLIFVFPAETCRHFSKCYTTADSILLLLTISLNWWCFLATNFPSTRKQPPFMSFLLVWYYDEIVRGHLMFSKHFELPWYKTAQIHLY